MDPQSYLVVYRAKETELERRLEQRRAADEIRAERLAAGIAPHPASHPRRRLADLFRTPRRAVRLA